MFIFPSSIGAADQSASDNSAKIGINDNNAVTVNAASKSKKFKAKKVSKAKKTYKKTTYKYKKVKASSNYSKTSYKSSSARFTSDSTIDSIMRSGAKYGYKRGVSSSSAMQSVGAGDCWAMSEYLNNQFKASGYNSRVIQYKTSYSSKHRSVQINQNGKWITVPYRSYGYNRMFV